MKNFPFDTFEDLKKNFDQGLAEPRLIGKIHREIGENLIKGEILWTFQKFLPIVCYSLIVYITISIEELNWYHSILFLLASIISMIGLLDAGSRNRIAPKIFGVLLLFGIIFFSWGKSQNFIIIGFLSLLAAFATSWRDRMLITLTVKELLKNESLFKDLWEKGRVIIDKGGVIYKFNDSQQNINKNNLNL